MSKILQVGIASYGLSGQVFHGPFLKKHHGFKVASVFERTKELSKKDFPEAKIVRSYEELITDSTIDLIIVNTPTQLHFSMALKALKAGKHVVLEKPFTVNFWEAEKLVKIATEKDLTLAIYHNRRLESGFKTVKKLLEDKEVGKPQYFKTHLNRDKELIGPKKWKEDNSKGAGMFYDLAPHLLDQAITLFGLPENVVSKLEKQRPETQVVDYFFIQLKYSSGLLVELEAGMYIKQIEPKYLLKGTDGCYEKIKDDHQETLLRKGIYPPNIDPDSGILTNKLGNEKVIDNVTGSYLDFYHNLYEVIVEKKELLIKKEEALQVMKIMEDILSSN